MPRRKKRSTPRQRKTAAAKRIAKRAFKYTPVGKAYGMYRDVKSTVRDVNIILAKPRKKR